MVTHLLTLKIKVDFGGEPNRTCMEEGRHVKKKSIARISFWDWLLGGGWTGGGSNG